ncbi:MAG: GH3 auxin-responsive promoter family protein [Bacillota bacterium]
MTNLSLPKIAFAKRRRQLRRSSGHPLESQEKILRFLVAKGSQTEFGKKYLLSSVRSHDDFRRQVPVSRYEDLQPYIERMLAGEENVLWPEAIDYFSKSSGTTGSKSKYIPVSARALSGCHYKAGRSLFAEYFHQNPASNLLLGQNFALGGSRQDAEIGSGKYIADVSVILMKNLPWWARLRRSPRFSVASMSEWESKLEKIAGIISKQNIVSISGVPSWNLALARKVLEMTGKNNLKEVWPKLELFVHGGTSMAPYREQFRELIPGKMNYLEVYNASEGFFAFQDDLTKNDLLLFVDGGVYYEFIPLEELEKPKPEAIPLAQVEVGKNYAMLISTNAGLWRYFIGDTVKFTSADPYRLVITGRTKSFINACGEELMVENAESAIKEACNRSGAIMKEYTAAPLFGGTSIARHQWAMEFERQPEDLQVFKQYLDEALMNRNSDYEAKRHKDLNLAPPEIIIVRSGIFYDWLKSRNRLGGQAKIPRLANDRYIIEEILALNRN